MKYFLFVLLFAGSVFGATQEKKFVFMPGPKYFVEAVPRYVLEMNYLGQPLHWDVDKQIAVKMDASMPSFAVEACNNALRTWNEQINNILNFNQLDQYSSTKGDITFLWDLVDVPQDTRLADTTVSSKDGIHITSVVVTFYALAYNFHAGYPFGTSPSLGTFGNNLPQADIQGTALHECGHVLGLLHSTTVVNGDYPVMFPSITTQSSYLHADDIVGIVATYANALAEASDPNTDQDKMVKLFAEIGVQYTVSLNQTFKKPTILSGQKYNQVQITSGVKGNVAKKTNLLFLFQSSDKKFSGTLIGGTQFMARQE